MDYELDRYRKWIFMSFQTWKLVKKNWNCPIVRKEFKIFDRRRQFKVWFSTLGGSVPEARW